MKRMIPLTFPMAAAMILGACTQSFTGGTLDLTITGLPTGVAADVTVTGPDGFDETVTASDTFTGLSAGEYTVTARDVGSGGAPYTAVVSGSPAQVTAGGTSEVNVSYAAPSGDLSLSSSGLPAGESGNVVLSGPDGYSEEIRTGETVTDLRVGAYILYPDTVLVDNSGFAGEERFDAAPQDVEVEQDATAAVSLGYSYSGLTISDPPDDAVGESTDDPIYELTGLRTVVEGGMLLLALTFSEEQDDFSVLQTFVDLNIDQDDATGEPYAIGRNCAVGPEAGSEYSLEFTGGSEATIKDLTDDSTVGTAMVTTGENKATFAIDLSDIGDDDGRMDVGVLLGNSVEPTDCLRPFDDPVIVM